MLRSQVCLVAITYCLLCNVGSAADKSDALPPGALARLGTLRLRHANKINAVAFSPDGMLLASASGEDGGRDSTVRLWDVATGAERRRFTGHAQSVYCVAFSPDGKLIASGGKEWWIAIWEAATGREVRRLTGHKGAIQSVAFSPDGKTLASAASNEPTARLWDVATGDEIRQFTAAGQELSAVAFTPDGDRLVTGSTGAGATLWDVATGKQLRRFGDEHTPRAAGLGISPDGQLLATADGEVRLYFLPSGAARSKLGGLRTDIGGSCVAFSPDGNHVATAGASGRVCICDFITDKVVREFTTNAGASCLAYSRDGKLIAAGGSGNTVRIWETATGKELHAGESSQGQVFFVGFAESGKVALTGDGPLRAWDLGDERESLARHGRRGEPFLGVTGTILALSPDRKTVVTGGWSGKFRLFDVAVGAEIHPFAIPPTDNAIRAVFTPDGKRLIVLHTDMRTMALWDLTTGREVHRFQGHNSPVDAIAISPDGKTLVSSGTPRAMFRRPPPGFQEDTGTRVWDVATGKELRQIPGREGTLAYSPDGTLLAAGTDGWNSAIRLVDVVTGTELRRLQFPRYGPFRIVFSPDGKMLASVGRDPMVRLYEVATGGERRHFEGHAGELYSVAFSSDGRRLLTGGADTTAILWDVYAADGPGPADLAAAVRGLDGSDAATAHRAVCALIRAADKAVPAIAAAVRPAEPADRQRLAQLLADLDAERFPVREQATAELAKLEHAAEPALRQLLAGKPSPEARRRAEKLLEAIKVQVSPTILRGLRAVEVLEAIHTLAARAELERLAGGAPGVRLTREARAALDRLTAAPPDGPA